MKVFYSYFQLHRFTPSKICTRCNSMRQEYPFLQGIPPAGLISRLFFIWLHVELQCWQDVGVIYLVHIKKMWLYIGLGNYCLTKCYFKPLLAPEVSHFQFCSSKAAYTWPNIVRKFATKWCYHGHYRALNGLQICLLRKQISQIFLWVSKEDQDGRLR